MCSECKTLVLATDPGDESKFEAWLPHDDDDLNAGYIWVGVTENEPGAEFHETSIVLSPGEQDQLIDWIQKRRRERTGKDN